MAELASIQIEGAKDAIRYLTSLDKELKKEFVRDAKRIASPLVEEAKARYPERLLSGMERNWSQKGRRLFPYDQGLARRGVKVSVTSARGKRSFISVVQSNPAAAIVEFAGRGEQSAFAQNLTARSRPPARVMWPAAEVKWGAIQSEMADAVDNVVAQANRRLL